MSESSHPIVNFAVCMGDTVNSWDQWISDKQTLDVNQYTSRNWARRVRLLSSNSSNALFQCTAQRRFVSTLTTFLNYLLNGFFRTSPKFIVSKQMKKSSYPHSKYDCHTTWNILQITMVHQLTICCLWRLQKRRFKWWPAEATILPHFCGLQQLYALVLNFI